MNDPANPAIVYPAIPIPSYSAQRKKIRDYPAQIEKVSLLY